MIRPNRARPAVNRVMYNGKTKCVFVDRDGTLIRHIPYLSDPRRVEVLPTVSRGLSELLMARCLLYLHTNQSGIGRGYFSREEALACNAAMLSQIGLGSDLFEDVCLCPETPEQAAAYRKPSPRYAQEVMARHGVGPNNACYVGDNVTDLLTARNVGCAGIGVSTGVPELRQQLLKHGLTGYPVYDNFLEAASDIVERLGCADGRD